MSYEAEGVHPNRDEYEHRETIYIYMRVNALLCDELMSYLQKIKRSTWA